MDVVASDVDEAVLWRWVQFAATGRHVGGSAARWDLVAKLLDVEVAVGGNDEAARLRVVSALRSHFPPRDDDTITSAGLLLCTASLVMLRRVGISGTTLETQCAQLVDVLREFVAVPDMLNVWAVLSDVTHLLAGWRPAYIDEGEAVAIAELACVLRLFGVPLLLDRSMSASRAPGAPGALIALAVCIPALRSPSLILLPQQQRDGAGDEWVPASRLTLQAGVLKQELKQCSTVEQLHELVWRKQREVDVLHTRLSKLDHAMKKEKVFWQSQLHALEAQAKDTPSLHALQEELDSTRAELSAMRQQVSLDRTGMEQLQRRIRQMQFETTELEVTAERDENRKSVEAEVAQRVRRIGGQRWAYLPWAQLLFTVLALVGLSMWAYRNGHLDNVGFPCISDMMNLAPESCFGAMFTAIESTALFFIGLLRWRLNMGSLDAHNLRTMDSSRYFHKMNHVAVLCNTAACVGLVGIGAFQYHNLAYAHLAFDGVFFAFVSLCFVLFLRIDWRLGHASVAMLVLRLVLLVVQTAAMIVCYTVTFVGGFDIVEGVTEMVSVAMMMFQLLTFASELGTVEVLFDVRQLSSEEAAARNASETLPLMFDFDDDD